METIMYVLSYPLRYILNELSNINLSSVNHNELSKILAEHKKISAERESLKLVLKKALNMQNFKNWINSKTDYVETYIIMNP